MGTTLRKGENIPIAEVCVAIRCRWESAADVDGDVSALLLHGRHVRTDADFIFYNQAESPDGAVQHLGKRSTGNSVEDRIAIDLVAVDADVDAIAIVLSVDHGRRLANLGPVVATVLDGGGTSLASFTMADFTVETAAVAMNVYRRDQWKVRAVGQGYHDGLAGLARDFGVTIDEEAPPPMPPAESLQSTSRVVDWAHPPVPAGYEF
ncbi:TerD family protein [Mycolicibacterium sp. 018/SC-01/001]|uniref:TerD family protein n=1 Tax=Mycolicibacterium sp. 018/SC-01/001 TaxID=2592069 RepID=UPI00117E7049|nr:TerD family protein [Mycolicibacterium sp. 018/SC-01/001]TRW86216.1 TerD family protein [Mycolicibacterium sp. 018/SC-01/001]